MKAYLICCNDDVVGVVLNDPILAGRKLEELSMSGYSNRYRDWFDYKDKCKWQIRVTEVIENESLSR